MTPEDREKLRLTLVAMGVVERSENWTNWWELPQGLDLPMATLIDKCGCGNQSGCPSNKLQVRSVTVV